MLTLYSLNPIEPHDAQKISIHDHIANLIKEKPRKGLRRKSIKTIMGKDKRTDCTIKGIFTNEKYYGAAILSGNIFPWRRKFKSRRKNIMDR